MKKLHRMQLLTSIKGNVPFPRALSSSYSNSQIYREIERFIALRLVLVIDKELRLSPMGEEQLAHWTARDIPVLDDMPEHKVEKLAPSDIFVPRRSTLYDLRAQPDDSIASRQQSGQPATVVGGESPSDAQIQ